MNEEKLISKIAVGSVQFGLDYGISNFNGQTPLTEVKAILSYAHEKGIQCIDTARAYGESEAILGAAGLDGFRLISKLPTLKDDEQVLHLFNTSINNLGVESLFGYLSHDSSMLIENPSIWDDMQLLKSKSLVKKIGFSLYSPDELDKLLSLNFVPDLVQVPYSLLDQRFKPYFKDLKNLGIEIHTRSAFLQGLYFMPITELSGHFSPLFDVLNRIHENFPLISDKAGALLRFCLKEEEIDNVVVGVNTKVQLKENIEAIGTNVVDFLEEMNVNDIKEELLMPNLWPKK